LSALRAVTRAWHHYEVPTLAVALAVYGGWLALTRYHAALPWWAVVSFGAWLIAWQGSVQHETIHALRHVPRPLRAAIAYVPLGLFFSFGSYRRDHRRHHSAGRLTEPQGDPESFYHDARQWRRYAPVVRWVFRLNQTPLGRLTIGPALQAVRAYRADFIRIREGDRDCLRDWRCT
jgi:fatty acid desaturase